MQDLVQKLISFSEINMDDRRYRVSRDMNLDYLTSSLRQTGLLNYPRVRQMDKGYILVTGFRRVKAIMDLAGKNFTRSDFDPGDFMMDKIPVMVMKENDDTDRSCSFLAIVENAFQRPLDTMEQVRAVMLLNRFMTVEEIALQSICLFNMDMNPRLVQKLMDLGAMSEEIHNLIDDSRLSMTAAIRLKWFDPLTQELFVKLFATVKLNLNKQIEIITNVSESAARDGISAMELMQSDPVQEILSDDTMDGARKGNLLRLFFARLRYPAVSTAMATFDKTVKKLNLGSEIRLEAPQNFEARHYSVSFKFATIAEFKARVATLCDLTLNPVMRRIVK